MDENSPTYPSLREALEANNLLEYFRDHIHLRPGQTWSVLEKGRTFTITRHQDGGYYFPDAEVE